MKIFKKALLLTFLGLIILPYFGQSSAKAANVNMVSNVILGKTELITDGQDVMSAKIIVNNPNATVVSMIVNYPTKGTFNHARGYFQYNRVTNQFVSVGGVYYGKQYVSLITTGPDASNVSIESDKITVEFKWVAFHNHNYILYAEENKIAVYVSDGTNVSPWRIYPNSTFLTRTEDSKNSLTISSQLTGNKELLAGGTSQVLGKFLLNNSGLEKLSLYSLTFSLQGKGPGFNNNNTFTNFRLIDSSGNQMGNTLGSAIITKYYSPTTTNSIGEAQVRISGFSLVIPSSLSTSVSLVADVTTMVDFSTTYQAVLPSYNIDRSAIGAITTYSLRYLVGNEIKFSPAGDYLYGPELSIIPNGSLLVEVSYLPGHTYSGNTVKTIGVQDEQFSVFKFRPAEESVALRGLILSSVSDPNNFSNVSLYLNSESIPFAVATQFVQASSTGSYYEFVFSTPVILPVNQDTFITVKADINQEGVAKVGDEINFSINSLEDIRVYGNISTLRPNILGSGVVNQTKQIVPAIVSITGITLMDNTTVSQSVSAGTSIGTFSITNAGNFPVSLSNITISDGGSNSGSNAVYDLLKSEQNSFSPSGAAVASSTKINSQYVFVPNIPIIVDPGSYVKLFVKVNSTVGLAQYDSWRLYVANIGDVLYSVQEANLGYDGNLNGQQIDLIDNLLVIGTPSLGTLIKSN